MNSTAPAFANTSLGTAAWQATRSYDRGILITIMVAFAVQIPIGIPGNLYICLFLYKRKDLRKATHILLWNLSFVGVLVSATYVPLFLFVIVMVQFVREPHHIGWGIFRYSYAMLLFGVQTLTIVVMAIERHDAVMRPFKRRITATNVQKVVLWLWFFVGVTFAVHLPLGANDAVDNRVIYNLQKKAPSLILTVALTNLYLFGAIIVIFATFARIVKRLRSSPFAESNARAEARVTRLTYYLMFTYVISWLPIILAVAIGRKLGATEIQLEAAKVLLLGLSNISYLVNPLIHMGIVNAAQRQPASQSTEGSGREQDTRRATDQQ